MSVMMRSYLSFVDFGRCSGDLCALLGEGSALQTMGILCVVYL